MKDLLFLLLIVLFLIVVIKFDKTKPAKEPEAIKIVHSL